MSKQTEALKVLRDMTGSELDDHLRVQRRRLFELRFQQATGQVENHRQIRDTRREIARTMTMQIELARLEAVGAVGPRPAAVSTAAAEEPPEPRRRRSRRAAEAAAPEEPAELEAAAEPLELEAAAKPEAQSDDAGEAVAGETETDDE